MKLPFLFYMIHDATLFSITCFFTTIAKQKLTPQIKKPAIQAGLS